MNELNSRAEGMGATDRAAQMEAIVAEHETALLRYAARIVNNSCVAQDVVQNVFIKIFRRWEKGLQPSEHLKAWLFRVTHNEAVDQIRKESRLRVLHTKHGEERKANDCPDGHECAFGGEERKELVLQYLGKLHPREQQVILLRMEQGLSYKEISAVTGRSEGNVGNILHHGVRKLSQALKQAGVVAS
ncbi:MAG: sigma-70 family RNA polymerase sigma factor [Kiritimatiellia bacterium]|nr:sigma-70 family RNA polymerase sigma factor [Kiritimatiellia bacterium]MDP6848231.1 sigma-70 family RNA polymerase sigma factor [Kiritimatiellia bacterium]